MEKSILNVDGMMCAHCVEAVKKAVSALSGIGGVSVDLRAKTVTVEHDPPQTPVERIKKEIEDQGYDVLA